MIMIKMMTTHSNDEYDGAAYADDVPEDDE